jgi:hypothetical protein
VTQLTNFEDAPGTDRFVKPVVCIFVLFSLLVVVCGTNYISRLEFLFSDPPKRANLDDLPALANYYFRFYNYTWIVAVAAFAWCTLLIARNCRWGQIALFASASCLFASIVLMICASALYLCNQRLVFNFQHLE